MGRGTFHPVERLVAVRTEFDGERSFKARWVGFGPKDDTWVSQSDLNDDPSTFALSPSVAKVLGVSKTTKKDDDKSSKESKESNRKPTSSNADVAEEKKNVDDKKSNDEDAPDKQEIEREGENKDESKDTTPEKSEKEEQNKSTEETKVDGQADVQKDLENEPETEPKNVESKNMAGGSGEREEGDDDDGNVASESAGDEGEVRRSSRIRTSMKRLVEEMDTAPRPAPKRRRKSSTGSKEKPSRSGKDSGEFWAVERILGSRGKGVNREFKIRWKGFSWRFDTWVSERDLEEPPSMYSMALPLRKKLKAESRSK